MKKYENFQSALLNLKDIYNYDAPYENVVLTGLVALFSICFEQSWKAMKEILEDNGFDESKTGSPKQIIKLAYSAGMIGDEEAWLDALVSRNNVAHAYKKEVALDIVNATKETYYNMFRELDETLQKNWLTE